MYVTLFPQAVFLIRNQNLKFIYSPVLRYYDINISISSVPVHAFYSVNQWPYPNMSTYKYMDFFGGGGGGGKKCVGRGSLSPSLSYIYIYIHIYIYIYIFVLLINPFPRPLKPPSFVDCIFHISFPRLFNSSNSSVNIESRETNAPQFPACSVCSAQV